MHLDLDKPRQRLAPEPLVPDIGVPFPARFDFRTLGDAVAELDAGVTVKAEVGLFVPGGGTVGVGGDVSMAVADGGGGWSGGQRGCGGEGAKEG